MMNWGHVHKGTGKRGIMEDSAVELLIGLLKQASMISSPMRDCVATCGEISVSELKLMLALSGEGQAAGHDLSEIMGMSAMNVSRALAQLLRRGWIEPVGDHSRRRRKPVRLTAAGKEALGGMMPQVAIVASELLDVLTPREKEQLGRINSKIEARLKDWIEQHHGDIHLV